MKSFPICAGMLLVLALGACKKEAKNNADRPLSAATIILPCSSTLPATVESGDTLRLSSGCCGATYFLNGKCFVKSGGVLIIGPGVTIRGVSKPTPAEASALVICRGGRIFADGTATQPITFTSTVDSVGGWGGVVILGRAPVNKSNPAIEGIDLPTLPAGVDVNYGGTILTDNSGRLHYVKILNAGAAIGPNNELNSLTLGGVGSGTSIHHVYAAKSRDDAFQLFGGTVRLTHIIAQSATDDAFDFEFGYRGAIQFALAFVKTADNVFSDANGIETDNDATGSSDQPQTCPVISNMTIIGGNCTPFPGVPYGFYGVRNASVILYNSVIMGYNYGVYVLNSPGVIAGVKYNVLHGFTAASNVPLHVSNTQFSGGCSNVGILLRNPFGTLSPGFDARPSLTSPAACCSNFTEIAAFGFTSTTYRGAFSPSATTALDWAAFAVDNTPCN